MSRFPMLRFLTPRLLLLAALALTALAAPASAQTYAGLSIGVVGNLSDTNIWFDARAARPVGPPVVLGQPLRAGGRLGFINGNGSAAILPEVTLAAHPLAAGLLDPYVMAHAGYGIGISGSNSSGEATAGVEVGVALRLTGVGVSLFADLRRGGTTLGTTISF